MGGFGSGQPVARESVEEAFRLIDDGMSQRQAARQVGVGRDTLSKLAKDPLFRRTTRRCPTCAAIVRMPCLLCSAKIQDAATKRAKRLRKAARRRVAS